MKPILVTGASGLFGGEVAPAAGGRKVSCGLNQEVRVLTPEAISARDPSFSVDPDLGPVFAGMALVTSSGNRVTTPAGAACGAFVEWTSS